MNKTQQRDKITSYLSQLNPEKSILSQAITGAIKYPWNFENVIKLCKDAYVDNPRAITEVVGEVPMRLILKYN